MGVASWFVLPFISADSLPALQVDYHWRGCVALGWNTQAGRQGWPGPFPSSLWGVKASACLATCSHFTGVAST